MSRTYRRNQVELDCNCGEPVWRGEDRENYYIRQGIAPWRGCRCTKKVDYFSKRNFKRDRKPYWKTPKVYKVIMNRKRRAVVRDHMVHEKYEIIPKFRRENDWIWN